MKTQTVYKIEHNGVYCIVFLLEDALDMMKCDIEDNYEKDGDPLEFKLTIIEMTEEEIEALPEFEGF